MEKHKIFEKIKIFYHTLSLTSASTCMNCLDLLSALANYNIAVKNKSLYFFLQYFINISITSQLIYLVIFSNDISMKNVRKIFQKVIYI